MLGIMLIAFALISLIRTVRNHRDSSRSLGPISRPSAAYRAYRARPLPRYGVTDQRVSRAYARRRPLRKN